MDDNTWITLYKTLRQKLIKRRKELNITACELSERSGHSKYWLSNIEGGKVRKIRHKDLNSICQLLEIDINTISNVYTECIDYSNVNILQLPFEKIEEIVDDLIDDNEKLKQENSDLRYKIEQITEVLNKILKM